MRKLFLPLLILTVFLTGCAHTTRTNSYLARDLPPDALSRAADDLTAFLAAAYPPGQTALNLDMDETVFQELLADRLRAKGFEIMAPPSGAGHRLTCVIDKLEDGASCYHKAVLADGQIFSKVYFFNDEGLLNGAATHGQKVGASDFQKTGR